MEEGGRQCEVGVCALELLAWLITWTCVQRPSRRPNLARLRRAREAAARKHDHLHIADLCRVSHVHVTCRLPPHIPIRKESVLQRPPRTLEPRTSTRGCLVCKRGCLYGRSARAPHDGGEREEAERRDT